MTDAATPAPAAAPAPSKAKSVLDWLVSFAEPFKSRTNTVLFVGLVAYVFERFANVHIDQAAAADAVVNAAGQVNPTMSVSDLIVLGVTVLGAYFRSNPKASF